ncbi:GNAT family N-acetyltransferase [Sulfitobacter sp. D35]|uniref:GNAT family N-acetyltransferase n=1 Tax=Sulfitobacter sp. D35 TaxID=3083252 RepID=UPI00296EF678|nr:GNAT family N-acetyltransferase [Sulfitobacter sp. D35]MDW4500130.1 GNAT family N-acetyltransferase [Sulfitobacter sp. D35]
MLRWADQSDAAALGEVFHRAIREGTSPYSEAQRAAWSPRLRAAAFWTKRLAGLETLLEETDGRILGFMSMDAAGYVDLAFILPEVRGTGMFRRLLTGLEDRACGLGIARLWTFASLSAEPAFRSAGFRVIHREEVEMTGQILRRAKMEKPLA